MDLSNKILESREERKRYIASLTKDFQIISVKANIPGLNKNTKEAYVIVNHFTRLIEELKPIKIEKHESLDGIYVLFYFDKEEVLKEKTIYLEEHDEIGRFVDLDVYLDSNPLSRNTLRECFLCDDYAFVCQRNKKHNLEEINEFIRTSVLKYLEKNIKNIIDESILKELNMEDKFGLVCPSSNGSHKDMNYDLMIKAKNSIIDDIWKMFQYGYENDDLNDIKDEIRKIGLDAEEKMMIATGNINAYKGLIFVLGMIATSVGYKISRSIDLSIFDIAKILCKDITLELKDGCDTFGKYAYQRYGIGGAREEAENGFINIQNVLERYNLNDDLKDALVYLIINCDDTTLLKRCGDIDKYNSVKEEFKKEKDYLKLSKKCIEDNLSFGGAADLLVTSIFIKKAKEIFKI